jgi:hypothetical protein
MNGEPGDSDLGSLDGDRTHERRLGREGVDRVEAVPGVVADRRVKNLGRSAPGEKATRKNPEN